MKERTLYPLWAAGYLLCVCLGAIPERSALGQLVLDGISLLFFVPGFWLLYLAHQKGDGKCLKGIRLVSLCSLVLTTVLLAANLVSILSDSVVLGDSLYILLLLFSAPLPCCSHWITSLFLWACLLFASIPGIWRKKDKKIR